jgi:hypothetical protein
MQVSGEWFLCDDGVERPVIRGEVLTGRGTWEPALFLVETGADRTVLDAIRLEVLQLPAVPTRDRLGGLGGLVNSVGLATTIRLTEEDGGKVTFRGEFAAVTDPEALDMSVLGREITGLFAVIVDRPGNAVRLVGQRHRYVIAEE